MGRGREIQEFDFTMQFNKPKGLWETLGQTSQYVTNTTDDEIIDVLTRLQAATFTQIHNAVGKSGGYISQRLDELVDKGILIVTGKGKGALYSYIGHPLPK